MIPSPSTQTLVMVSKGRIEVDSIPLYIAIGHGEKRGRLRVDSIPLYIAIGHHVDVDGRLFKE